MKKLLSIFTVLFMTFICAASFNTLAVSNGIVCIDSPKASAAVGNRVTVSGWSVNLKGVKSVSVYVDNKYYGKAQIGITRNDVARIYGKTYAKARTSGYKYTLNTSSLSNGKHTIKIISYGNNGVNTTQTRTFIKANPSICVDSPSSNIRNNITADFKISGWSVSVAGVKSVTIKIDGKAISGVSYGNVRNDVNRIVNSKGYYSNAVHSGYSCTVSASSLTTGTHTVQIISTSKDGTSISSSFKIIKTLPSPIAKIESTSNGKIYMNDVLNVNGYALSHAGVKSVAVYVDNTYVGNAKTGLSSPDVNSSENSSGYYQNGATAKYSFTLSSTTKYGYGNHTVKVVSTGNDGVKTTATITAQKLAPQLWIDNPKVGNTFSGDFEIRGWAISNEGVCTVKAYIDGKEVTGVANNIARADVKTVMNSRHGAGAYKDSEKSGYCVTASATSLAAGKHTLVVKVYSPIQNTMVSKTVTFNVKKASPITHIENPNSSDCYVTDSLFVKGWSVNASGVKSVAVYIDNKYVCNAESGLERADVNRVINKTNSYLNAKYSGYKVTIPMSKLTWLSTGNHTLKIVSTGNDGSTCANSIVITRKTPIISLSQSNIKADLDFKISGWAVTASGVKSIVLKYGTHSITLSDINLTSADIKSKYDPNGKYYSDAGNSRFDINVDIDTLQSGSNTLAFYVTENDGRVFKYTTTVQKINYHTKYSIDSPKNGTSYNKYLVSSFKVYGWALSPNGVAGVGVTIDGKSVAVTTGVKSDQAIINVAGGLYDGASNARFTTANLSLSNYDIGEHKLVITITGKNGVVTTINQTFIVTDRYYTCYNITAQKMSDLTGVNIALIDPTQIINNSAAGIYQFMTLNYVDGITAAQMNAMLTDCGALANHGQDFIDAGKQYNVNPVYLAAHARIESGNGSSKLSNGVEIDGVKYYNQYGIHAYDSDPVNQGAQYAKKQGWTSVRLSIFGGAKWISSIYIWGGKPNQDTLYEMRFDPAYYDGTYSSKYCYATDSNWASNIAKVIYQYRSILDGKAINFDIPKYK